MLKYANARGAARSKPCCSIKIIELDRWNRGSGNKKVKNIFNHVVRTSQLF
jgi:hypothetical protein